MKMQSLLQMTMVLYIDDQFLFLTKKELYWSYQFSKLLFILHIPIFPGTRQTCPMSVNSRLSSSLFVQVVDS